MLARTWPETPRLPDDRPLLLLMPTLALDGRTLGQFSGWLSEPEQVRMARFVRERDRHQYCATRVLLRTLLGRALGCHPQAVPLVLGARGKPEVAATFNLSFSVSHTEGWVVIALARGARLGVDIESALQPPPDYRAVAEAYYDPQEWLWMQATDDTTEVGRRFIEHWTLKESYLKATGHGLSKSLRHCVFLPSEESGLIFEDREPAEADAAVEWDFALWSTATGHRIALAAAGAPGRAASSDHWLASPSTAARPTCPTLLRRGRSRSVGLASAQL
jgi:4'-phosphopantetheinyl transferase